MTFNAILEPLILVTLIVSLVCAIVLGLTMIIDFLFNVINMILDIIPKKR